MPIQILLFLLVGILLLSRRSTLEPPPPPTGGQITGVTFDGSTHKRLAPGSDNWPTTWADDGHIYTAWGDGGGFGSSGGGGSDRVSLGVARVIGSPTSYTGININGGRNNTSGRTQWPNGGTEGKSYGMICIGGSLFMWVTGGTTSNIFDFVKLYQSTNHGNSWTYLGVQFTNSGEGLCVPTILNFGQNYAGVPSHLSGFVYHYFIETQDTNTELRVQRPGRIHLLRTPINSIQTKSAYQYFSGTPASPAWSSSRSASRPVFEDSNGVGWNVACSYNIPLKRYILTTEHTESHQGFLGMFDAPEPWGPWEQILYTGRNWEGFNNSTGQGDGCFYWNFPTKWISSDGKSFTMVFTGGNPGPLDSWNTINGRFVTA